MISCVSDSINCQIFTEKQPVWSKSLNLANNVTAVTKRFWQRIRKTEYFQAELRQQLNLEGKEPIYQNLPAHDRIMMDNLASAENDDNVDDEDELNTTTYEKDITEEDSIEKR